VGGGAYNVLEGRLQEKENLEDLDFDGRKICKLTFKK
jgi:hypothetical protein